MYKVEILCLEVKVLEHFGMSLTGHGLLGGGEPSNDTVVLALSLFSNVVKVFAGAAQSDVVLCEQDGLGSGQRVLNDYWPEGMRFLVKDVGGERREIKSQHLAALGIVTKALKLLHVVLR